MAKKRITSKPGLFGYTYHYDERGKRIGKSRPRIVGDGDVYYDAEGEQVGKSRPGVFAKSVYIDQKERRRISSYEGWSGDVHFEDGSPIGVSYSGFFDEEYTILNIDDEVEEDLIQDEYLDDSQESAEYNEAAERNVQQNRLGFVICVILVGILILILK